jgi:hypothetical protein
MAATNASEFIRSLVKRHLQGVKIFEELTPSKYAPRNSCATQYVQQTQHATRNTQHATRNTQHATRNTRHATRNTHHATGNTQHTTRNRQHATRNTHHASRITHHATRNTFICAKRDVRSTVVDGSTSSLGQSQIFMT